MAFNFWDAVGKVADSGILNSISSAFAGSFGANDKNTTVLEIVDKILIQDVNNIFMNMPHECMLLYSPNNPKRILDKGQQQPTYNIILRQPNLTSNPAATKMFSIFRTNDNHEANHMFGMYRESISALVRVDSTICDKSILDEICSKLREPEALGWTALHVVAAFDKLSRIAGVSEFRKFTNSRCVSFSRTPLHVAIIYKNFSGVFELLNLGEINSSKDLYENNVIHLAAESSIEILAVLFEKFPKISDEWLNQVNQSGLTPFQIACKNNNQEAVKEIIGRSLSQLQKRSLKDDGTPLHWAGGVETLEFLLAAGCLPNVVNNSLQTPLHLAVKRGCLKSVICFLSHSVSSYDLKDVNGETPLHLAARLCFKSIIQALIVFGADCNVVNKEGESPRHLVCTSNKPDKDDILFYISAIGAKRCSETMRNKCSAGCLISGQSEGKPPSNYKCPKNQEESIMRNALSAFSFHEETDKKSKHFPRKLGEGFWNSPPIGGRLLCLDGGGIRGIVLTQILLYMEQEFGIRIIDLFDWVAGTSTGGILALALACGKSVAQIQGLYLRLKDRVFIGERPYNSDALDEFLKQEFGENTKMRSIQKPRVMITTALVDKIPVEFHCFRNYASPCSILGQSEPCTSLPENEFIWECAKRTGAAPSFFRLDGRFIDGGLISNNPTLDAMGELIQTMAALKTLGVVEQQGLNIPSVVVSLGTGIQPSLNCSAKNLDICIPRTFRDAVDTLPRIKTLVNLLTDQATQAEGQVVERARSWSSSIGVPFYRFSPRMSIFIDLDEKVDETLINLMWETRAYMFAHKHIVMELKHILLQGAKE